MNAELRGRKGLERSHDFHIWKVLGGGGALRGLKCLTYDSVVYFYFRYPLRKFLRDVRYGTNSGREDAESNCILAPANFIASS